MTSEVHTVFILSVLLQSGRLYLLLCKCSQSNLECGLKIVLYGKIVLTSNEVSFIEPSRIFSYTVDPKRSDSFLLMELLTNAIPHL